MSFLDARRGEPVVRRWRGTRTTVAARRRPLRPRRARRGNRPTCSEVEETKTFLDARRGQAIRPRRPPRALFSPRRASRNDSQNYRPRPTVLCASDIAFNERIVSTTVTLARAVAAADIDGDFDLDVLGVGKSNLYWFEADASQSFAAHELATPVGASHWDVVAADVDGDDDQDILVPSYSSDSLEWHENDGDNFFTERVITTAADGAYSVFPADVDGDADLDARASVETAPRRASR